MILIVHDVSDEFAQQHRMVCSGPSSMGQMASSSTQPAGKLDICS